MLLLSEKNRNGLANKGCLLLFFLIIFCNVQSAAGSGAIIFRGVGTFRKPLFQDIDQLALLSFAILDINMNFTNGAKQAR